MEADIGRKSFETKSNFIKEAQENSNTSMFHISSKISQINIVYIYDSCCLNSRFNKQNAQQSEI